MEQEGGGDNNYNCTLGTIPKRLEGLESEDK